MRKLEYERRKKGMTQLRLGFYSGLDPSYISRAERHGNVSGRNLIRIANALGWEKDPRELLEEVK